MLLLSFSLLYSKEAVCIKRGGILLLSLGLKIKFLLYLTTKIMRLLGSDCQQCLW